MGKSARRSPGVSILVLIAYLATILGVTVLTALGATAIQDRQRRPRGLTPTPPSQDEVRALTIAALAPVSLPEAVSESEPTVVAQAAYDPWAGDYVAPSTDADDALALAGRVRQLVGQGRERVTDWIYSTPTSQIAWSALGLLCVLALATGGTVLAVEAA